MDLEEQANVMGGLQRQRSNQELAELNQQLREMRAVEEAAPKCPYCAGPIAEDVSKCRHCASDIEWAIFEEITIPCKSGQSAQIIAQLKTEKEEALQEDLNWIQSVLTEFPQCKKCKNPNVANNVEEAKTLKYAEGFCARCSLYSNDKWIWVILIGGGIFALVTYLYGSQIDF